MFALPGYDAFLGFLLISAAVPALALITNKLVSPKSRAGERQLTYESGMEPIGGAWIQFNIRYYMFALVFVIFLVALAYAWRKGALEWS